MARDWFIPGEYLVKVGFGDHTRLFAQPAFVFSNVGTESFQYTFISGTFGVGDFTMTNLGELGLSSEAIQITPHFEHRPIFCDDSPASPVEISAQVTEVEIKMTLIHYDSVVLDACIAEAMGGTPNNSGTSGGFANVAWNFRNTSGQFAISGKVVYQYYAGQSPGGGRLLGNNCMPRDSGCHFVSLNLVPGASGRTPWRFPTAYLDGNPLILPIGTEKSLCQLNFRAICYRPMLSGGREIFSGAVLWDHTNDFA